MLGARRARVGGEVLESIYSVIVLPLVLAACVELGDAATAVDVYRLIQYDIAGVPFGSRLAGLNHHAGSSFSATKADLSRTAVIVPVRKPNLSLLNEFITRKQPLGGLLLLLPQRTGSRESVGRVTSDKMHGDSLTRSILVELEKLLIHSYISGWLPGLKEDVGANQLPTIAIVASYDTFGAAPSDTSQWGVRAMGVEL